MALHPTDEEDSKPEALTLFNKKKEEQRKKQEQREKEERRKNEEEASSKKESSKRAPVPGDSIACLP